MKWKSWASVLLVLAFFSVQAGAAEFKGWCVKVEEGDTVAVYVNKKLLNVRLAYIDCPDQGQPFFNEAKTFTSDLILKKKVEVLIESYSGTQYLVGRVLIDGQDVSTRLVETGLAWYYRGHGSDRYLAKAFRKAKKQKQGIWSEKDPVPPWEFRGEKEVAGDEKD